VSSRSAARTVSARCADPWLPSERPASTDFQFGWWYAGVGQRWTGSLDMILGVEEQNTMPVTKGSCPPGTYKFAPGRFDNQCDMYHFWSPHAGGGANFLFADGSVHFLAYTAAPVLPQIATRAGGVPVAGEGGGGPELPGDEGHRMSGTYRRSERLARVAIQTGRNVHGQDGSPSAVNTVDDFIERRSHRAAQPRALRPGGGRPGW